MISTRFVNSIFKFNRLRYISGNNEISCSFCTNISDIKNENDVNKLFFNDEVQDLLKNLTRTDVKQVFKEKKLGKPKRGPIYKFMTDSDLEKSLKGFDKKVKLKLQMPPVMSERTEIDETYETNEKLAHYAKVNFVFTDISQGSNDRDRTIVVRDVDGTLRKAKWFERNRMNQIYFPVKGRELTPPSMFQPDKLKDVLRQGNFEFILDRACIQYEPDDPDYIRVTKMTYCAINEEKAYNELRSTRHYGPLVFYLAKTKQVDDLLTENMATDKLQDAVWLIKLYHLVNKDSKSKNIEVQDTDTIKESLNIIKAFVDLDSNKKENLSLIYQTYKEYLENPTNLDVEAAGASG